jgi:integrase
MRRGELLGLRWVDVDLTTGRVAIRHTLVMVDGKPAMAEPKTAKGRRSLTLAPEVLEALRAHRAHQAAERLSWGAHYTDSGLVVTTEDGRQFHPETLSALFVRQAKRAGLPPIRLHDLRHSVASILLARGVHPKVVSEMLGHANDRAHAGHLQPRHPIAPGGGRRRRGRSRPRSCQNGAGISPNRPGQGHHVGYPIARGRPQHVQDHRAVLLATAKPHRK